MFAFPRAPRFALLALSLFGLALPAHSQTAPAPKPVAGPVQTAPDPWLYVKSDLPHDPDWVFGRLPNGLRYAVRHNGVPPGQVSIRVRIAAGSLMEKDSERGFAHLLEHLTFRGSVYVPDGESKRIWQRFGVTFGSDSNAVTTFTNTVYKLDLPDVTPSSLDESFKILSGMMTGPSITAESLNAERPVVLSEAREQPGPQKRLQDAMFDLMFAGQPLAEREPIGTTETLEGATAASVKAFHQRWYRPERAVVVVVGDVDTATLEAQIKKYFTDWKGVGPAPQEPDFGQPQDSTTVSASIVEPAIPVMTIMTVARPWTVFADTVIFNQKRMVDLVALRIINRRLESRARAGGSFIGAGANLDDVARSANVTTVQVRPIGDNWEAALRDVRATIADAQQTPPTQAEIDREVAEIDQAMKNSVATWAVESDTSHADKMVEAVDINETVTDAKGSYSIFREAVDKGMFNPAAVQAASKKVFEGTAPRALVNLHTPDAQITTKVVAALGADVTDAIGQRKVVGDIGFDRLPKLGKAGTVVSRETVLAMPTIEKIVYSNGVALLLHENSSEVSKVYVTVRFGQGLKGITAAKQTPAWAGSGALVASGIGDLGQEELDALMGQHQVGFGFSVDDDAFQFTAQTNREDLLGQLQLFATKLAKPAWDPNPVLRTKAAVLSSYAGLSASPDAVLSRDLDALLHSGDPRWGIPSKAAISALTPKAFRAFWEPILATGPIEVEVFGDMDAEETIKAVGETFGALAPRTPAKVIAQAPAFPAHVTKPVTRTHTGQADQAAAVIAWPTGGGSAGISESRKIEVLAAVFRDRLLDKLRSEAGVSYSPNVASDWPTGMERGGKIMALGMVPPDKTEFFFDLVRGIAADLVANPISADELDRSLKPLKSMIIRASTGNPFWMNLVQGGTLDPARIAAVNTLAADIAYSTPAEIQALAAKYLRPEAEWTMQVLPEKKGN